MSVTRLFYRTRQFWQALWWAPAREDLKQLRSTLPPEMMALFHQLQPGEQAHSLLVWRRLVDQDEHNPDLLAAALLHDVGKSRFPLRLWERVLIVSLKAFFPDWATRWGVGAAKGWRRALVVAAQHPTWGAEMARQAGASARTQELIRRHQEKLPCEGTQPGSLEERLLRKLQAVDDES
ncbi:MAG TPA: HD domain-containing protein [Anaerolineales bacterium]|nr:HD domain-containing protein [Anaerolineales bacterium]